MGLLVVGACEGGGDGGGSAGDAGDGDDACVVGTEGCPCTTGGGCDPGLTCRSMICVDDSAGGDGGDGSDGGSGGSGDGSNGSGDGSNGSGDGSNGSGDGSDGSSDGGGGGTATTGDATGTDGQTGTSGGGTGTSACEGVDFLFVIDNSGSMAVHQEKVVTEAGAMVAAVLSEVSGAGHHIMVVDTDACPMMGGSCTPSGCEEILGAGQVRTCEVPNGLRYLTTALAATQLESSFECLTAVGHEGSGEEMPMDAMLEASTTQSEPSGCNPGFHREDSMLVVTIVSDDHPGWVGNDNANGVGTPQQWYDDLVAAKGGRADRIVVLSLVAMLGDQTCLAFGPQEADRFIEFTEMFGSRGIVASVCEPSYVPYLQEALDLIDPACR